MHELPDCLKTTFSKYNLKIVETIGDGSCLFHAFYNATNTDNYRDKNTEEKKKFVNEKRIELGNLYETIYIDYKKGNKIPTDIEHLFDLGGFTLINPTPTSDDDYSDHDPEMNSYVAILKTQYEKGNANLTNITDKDYKEKLSNIARINDNKIKINKQAIQTMNVYSNPLIIQLLEFFETTNIIYIEIDARRFKKTGYSSHNIDNLKYQLTVLIKLEGNHFEPFIQLQENNIQGLFDTKSQFITDIVKLLKDNKKKYIKERNSSITQNHVPLRLPQNQVKSFITNTNTPDTIFDHLFKDQKKRVTIDEGKNHYYSHNNINLENINPRRLMVKKNKYKNSNKSSNLIRKPHFSKANTKSLESYIKVSPKISSAILVIFIFILIIIFIVIGSSI
jgi:hypothetical protein